MSLVSGLAAKLLEGGPEPASLTCKECTDLSFGSLPINPGSLELQRSVTWSPGGEALAPYGSLSYAKGNPDSLSVQVLLDESEYQPEGLLMQTLLKNRALPGSALSKALDRILGIYNSSSVTFDMARLYALTMPIKATDGNAGGTMRPPVVLFHYGDFTFHGVVTSYSANMTLFGKDGSPRRAEVGLSLQGRSFQPGAWEEMFDAAFSPTQEAEAPGLFAMALDLAEPRTDYLAKALK